MRYQAGPTTTDYTYTGQYSYSIPFGDMDDPTTSGTTEGFGLMFYNARWYDPALGRFAQADTMIPQEQGTQAWDRYAYTNNNPIIYSDPTGHDFWPWFLSGVYQGIKNVVGSNTSTFSGLLLRGLMRFDSAQITGKGLTQIQADADVIRKQQGVIDNLINDSRYGQIAFSKKDQTSIDIDLAQHGSFPEEIQDPTFWTVNEGDLSAKNITVSKNGTIKVTWEVSDTFDYHPHWDTLGKRRWDKYLFYNLSAEVIQYWYHREFGATDVKTTATWEETIYPDEDDLQYQRGR